MLFIAIIISLAVLYFVQMKVYKKRTFDRLEYKVSLDSTEVTVGDDIYMYEELTNDKAMPLPYVKIATNLPVGLAFRLVKTEKGKLTDSFLGSIESIFVLKGRQRIRRRWRIACRKRGIYSLGNATVVSNDLIGFNPISTVLRVPKSKSTTVTVLPAQVDLERDFSSPNCLSGEILVKKSLLTDPMLRSGARDYTTFDPMNKINWKLSASHGKLLVNVEEYVTKFQSNVILNMCSQIIERNEDTPDNPEFIEYNITVAAAVIGRLASENSPVRLIANTPPETIHKDYIAGSDDTGSKIMMTPPFTGKFGMIDAMRTLAALEMKYSLPIEKLLDYVCDHPHIFSESGNIVFVTSVLDGRMTLFYEQMKRLGIDVIFYVTTSNRGIDRIPEGMKVFYRTYFDSYKAVGQW